jgi:hypothetical protein
MTTHLLNSITRNGKNLLTSGALITVATLAAQASKVAVTQTISGIVIDIRNVKQNFKVKQQEQGNR